MAIEYVFKPDSSLVLVLWQGKVNIEDWTTHLRRFLVDPAQKSIRKQITDLRFASLEGSFGEPHFSSILSLMGEPRDVFAGRRVAAVTSDEFDRARMFEQVSKTLGSNMIVFNDLDPACLWLGVDRKAVDEAYRTLKSGGGDRSG